MSLLMSETSLWRREAGGGRGGCLGTEQWLADEHAGVRDLCQPQGWLTQLVPLG